MSVDFAETIVNHLSSEGTWWKANVIGFQSKDKYVNMGSWHAIRKEMSLNSKNLILQRLGGLKNTPLTDPKAWTNIKLLNVKYRWLQRKRNWLERRRNKKTSLMRRHQCLKRARRPEHEPLDTELNFSRTTSAFSWSTFSLSMRAAVSADFCLSSGSRATSSFFMLSTKSLVSNSFVRPLVTLSLARLIILRDTQQRM